MRAVIDPTPGMYKRTRGGVKGASSANTVICRAALVSVAKSMSKHSLSDNNSLRENLLEEDKAWQKGKMLGLKSKESDEEMVKRHVELEEM
ncbi:hypothetical protein Dimus_001769, partial [Dionaea muscipula]